MDEYIPRNHQKKRNRVRTFSITYPSKGSMSVKLRKDEDTPVNGSEDSKDLGSIMSLKWNQGFNFVFQEKPSPLSTMLETFGIPKR